MLLFIVYPLMYTYNVMQEALDKCLNVYHEIYIQVVRSLMSLTTWVPFPSLMPRALFPSVVMLFYH